MSILWQGEGCSYGKGLDSGLQQLHPGVAALIPEALLLVSTGRRSHVLFGWLLMLGIAVRKRLERHCFWLKENPKPWACCSNLNASDFCVYLHQMAFNSWLDYTAFTTGQNWAGPQWFIGHAPIANQAVPFTVGSFKPLSHKPKSVCLGRVTRAGPHVRADTCTAVCSAASCREEMREAGASLRTPWGCGSHGATSGKTERSTLGCWGDAFGFALQTWQEFCREIRPDVLVCNSSISLFTSKKTWHTLVWQIHQEYQSTDQLIRWSKPGGNVMVSCWACSKSWNMSALSFVCVGTARTCVREKKTCVGQWQWESGYCPGVITWNGAVPLDLKDGRTKWLSQGLWLGSSTKLLAVSPVLGETRVAVWIFHSLHHPLGRWVGRKTCVSKTKLWSLRASSSFFWVTMTSRWRYHVCPTGIKAASPASGIPLRLHGVQMGMLGGRSRVRQEQSAAVHWTPEVCPPWKHIRERSWGVTVPWMGCCWWPGACDLAW